MSLPAPPGDAEFARAVAAMQRLDSVQMEERLQGSADGPLILADYRFHSPDALAFSVKDFAEVLIGSSSYRRETPSDQWTMGRSFPFEWPANSFSVVWGKGLAVRLLGTDVVDGVPTEIVAFLRPDLPAWFRIWVGRDDGLVHRELMLAEGHLMDHHYTAFDAAGEVRPPR